MNKEKFLALDCTQRVEYVNDLLKNNHDLQQIADSIGINYSTFTKLMTQGDYIFVKRDGQYFRFIRNGDTISSINNSADDLTAYLNENMDVLKQIIEKHKNSADFTIDKKIFASKLSTKTFRMPEELYQEFIEVCDERLPHLKIQHIIAQLLFNFIEKYK